MRFLRLAVEGVRRGKQNAQTYYGILSISESASTREIRDAYRTLTLLLHPDRHQNAPQRVIDTAVSKMASINEAYDCLCSTRTVPPSDAMLLMSTVALGVVWMSP
jgi:preprotein translocase subunit Sec63